jgi:uncharacterized protein HemY
MVESRVDRLLRLAEDAALAGDYDRSEALLEVLRPAIYLRRQEVKDLEKMLTPTDD